MLNILVGSINHRKYDFTDDQYLNLSWNYDLFMIAIELAMIACDLFPITNYFSYDFFSEILKHKVLQINKKTPIVGFDKKIGIVTGHYMTIKLEMA